MRRQGRRGCRRDDHVGLESDEFGRQCRQAFRVPFGVAVVDEEVLAFDPAVTLQAPAPHLEDPRIFRCGGKPTRRVLSWASWRAVRGHAAAAPPSSVMKSRRFIASPRLRTGHRSAFHQHTGRGGRCPNRVKLRLRGTPASRLVCPQYRTSGGDAGTAASCLADINFISCAAALCSWFVTSRTEWNRMLAIES